MFLVVLGKILVALLALALTRTFWRRWKYDLHKIPSPPCWPIIGHTRDFANQPDNHAKWFKQHYINLGCPKLFKVTLFSHVD